MIQFKQKKIALAVGTALLVMAGAAQAAVAPAARTAQPALVSALGAGAVEQLLTTAGANVGVTIDLALTSGAAVAIPAAGTSWTGAAIAAPSTATVVSTAGLAVGMAVTSTQVSFPTDAVILTVATATTFTFQSATTAVPISAAGANPATATAVALTVGGNVAAQTPGVLVIGNATPANNNVIVYTGTTATPVPSAVATAALAAPGAGSSHITISLPSPGAGNFYRLNAGVLEYSSAGAAFLPVKVDVQDAATNRLYTDMDNVAGFNAAATPGDIVATPITALAVGNSLAPTPVVVTTGTPTAAAPLISGISVDTVVPINAFTVVTNVVVTSQDPAGCVASLTGGTAALTASSATALTATSVTATLGAAVAATATLPPTFKNTVAFLPAADWTNSAVAADDALFANSPNCLNTGLAGATLPVVLSAPVTTPASYTQVFNTADGLATPVSFAGVSASATDGVAPILVSAATNATAQTLSLKFSEPMTLPTVAGLITAADTLREIAENVLVATDSLAALNLNNGGTLSIPAAGPIATTTGQSTLVITDASTALATYAAGKAITVNTGIHFGENNDGTGTTVTTTADPLGGLDSTSAVNEGASGTQTSAAAVLDAMFDATNAVATTARASTGTDPTKVATIQVKFPTAGAVAFAAGKTVTNLAGQIVVRVTGIGVGNAPVVWDFVPSATQMTLTNSTTLDITIPTALLYSKVAAKIAMQLMYLNNPGGGVAGPNVLVAAASATDVIDASTTPGITVSIPFAATAATNSLLTQSIIGSLTSAAVVNGDKVEAYVAKWVDAPATTGVAVTGITGALATGQGITFATGTGVGAGTLGALIVAEQAKIAAAQAAVPGVSNAVAAGVAANIPVWFVLTAGVPTLHTTAVAAAGAQTTLDNIIKTAAANAATAGSKATGADMSVSTYGGGTNNAGSLNSSMNAGVVAALGSIATSSLALAIPDAIVQAANTAAAAPGATVSSVVSALLKAGMGYSAIKTASVNPVTGAITGGVTGVITMTKSAGTVATRGLVFITPGTGADAATALIAGTWASGVVGTVNAVPNSYNLLLGIEPTTADLVLKKNPNWFVLLVHTPATTTTPADLNMLTSANPLATNFMPFSPNLITGSGVRTTLATNLAKLTKLAPVTGSTAWALYGLGAPSVNALAPVGHVASFPRSFVGIEATNSTPATFWTSDAASADMAMAMTGNKVAVATELGTNKDTLSTISNASFVPGAAALAWKNDAGAAANEHIDVLQVATAPAAGAIKVGPGWSLVTVPTGMATAVPAAVGAVIKVGAQVSSGYTWIKATDAATTPVPSLTAGEAVFVYSAAGGAIN